MTFYQSQIITEYSYPLLKKKIHLEEARKEISRGSSETLTNKITAISSSKFFWIPIQYILNIGFFTEICYFAKNCQIKIVSVISFIKKTLEHLDIFFKFVDK